MTDLTVLSVVIYRSSVGYITWSSKWPLTWGDGWNRHLTPHNGSAYKVGPITCRAVEFVPFRWIYVVAITNNIIPWYYPSLRVLSSLPANRHKDHPHWSVTARSGYCPVFLSCFLVQLLNQVVYNWCHLHITNSLLFLVFLGGRLWFLPFSLRKLHTENVIRSLPCVIPLQPLLLQLLVLVTTTLHFRLLHCMSFLMRLAFLSCLFLSELGLWILGYINPPTLNVGGWENLCSPVFVLHHSILYLSCFLKIN